VTDEPLTCAECGRESREDEKREGRLAVVLLGLCGERPLARILVGLRLRTSKRRQLFSDRGHIAREVYEQD